jgi:hypothetical protein
MARSLDESSIGSALRLERQQTALLRERDGLRAIARAEPPEDRGDMKFHGSFGDGEALRDAFVGESLRDELQYLTLTFGEARPVTPKRVRHIGGDAGRYPGLSLGGRCDGRE